MKQFLLNAFIILLCVSVSQGQDYKKLLKNANKTLSKYYSDPIVNAALLSEATTSIDDAFKGADAKADPEAWNTKGEIFNEIAKAEMNMKIIDPEYVLPTPKAAIVAYEAYAKAISLASKKSHTKDALLGLKNSEEFLNNMAITHFQVQEYDQAFENFTTTLEASKILKDNGEFTRLSADTTMADQIFYTGVCAYFGANKETSIPFFEQLYTAGNAQPLVYEALFNMTSETNIEKAMEYLDAGRKANPEDNGLLFAEINYYLKVGKLNILTDKLKLAIEKEPENVSVIVTLGNVYDQLNQKERAQAYIKYILGPKGGCYYVKDDGTKTYVDSSTMCVNQLERVEQNLKKADEYFQFAYDNFKKALAIDENNFDAVYSQGALYYNKAASLTASMNELTNDFTSAGTKKYNAIKAEMDGYFKQAEPYFLKAEKLDPKDANCLIALKEIYAREGLLEKSKLYKEKLEALNK